MGIFGRLFAKKERRLDEPDALDLGDIVRFKLYAPGYLAGQRFVVEAVNTYCYQGEQESEFVLRGHCSRTLFLSITNEDGEKRLWLSAKLKPGEIKALFDGDELAAIFDNEAGSARLHLQSLSAVPADLEGWFADEYERTVFSLPGEFFTGDYRGQSLPQDGAEDLDYYCLTNDDDSRAMVFEVYDSGDEVMVSIMTETTLIEELWPAGQTASAR